MKKYEFAEHFVIIAHLTLYTVSRLYVGLLYRP